MFFLSNFFFGGGGGDGEGGDGEGGDGGGGGARSSSSTDQNPPRNAGNSTNRVKTPNDPKYMRFPNLENCPTLIWA